MADIDAEAKVIWAEKRLMELERLIESYRATDPYMMRRSVEGKRQVERWRLHITEQPPPDVGLILGEFVYNLRAALDYIAADLVKPSYRTKIFYPFLQHRIWGIPVGDDASEKRHVDDRRKWSSVEREMPAAAVEIIKTFHPPDGQPKRHEPMYQLSILNALSNKDRHRNLNTVSPGLADAVIDLIYENGRVETLTNDAPPRPGVRVAHGNGAAIQPPKGVVDVKIRGTVAVSVEVSKEWASIRLPDDLVGIRNDVCTVIGLLKPFRR